MGEYLRKLRSRCLWFLSDTWLSIKSLYGKAKRAVLDRGVMLWWNRLYIRRDEFHPSLNLMDLDAILDMSPKQREKYSEDLMQRRRLAHERDLAEEDRKK